MSSLVTLRHDMDWRGGESGSVFAGVRKDPKGARDSSHCLLDPQELAEWMIADNVPARLGLQLHKFIWDPAVKGV